MMKKITLLLVLLTVSFGYAQTLPMDFEGTPVTSDFIDFDGGGATVKANPQMNGINTSATVVELIRNGGQVWAGSKIVLDSKLDFSTNNAIRMKVYTAAPVGTAVNFKIEDAADGNVFVEVSGVTTVQNAWETIEWDFSGTASGTYDALVFLFDIGNTGDGSATSTFLFDDVEQFDNTGGLAQIDLPINFEGSTINYTVTDFGGNASSLVVDPTDSGNMVIQSIKTSAAETWAGTTISTPSGLATDIPITGSDTKMNVRVWSPDAGIPIMLKIETVGDPTRSCETLTSTAVVAGWNTLEFDFSNERAGTAALNLSYVYNLVSIFFNFDVSGATVGSDKTYYFDDVKFGATVLSTEDFDLESFNIFPNPTRDRWTVKTKNANLASIKVFDVLGKSVLSLSPDSSEAIIDGSGLKSGLYFAQIKTANGTSGLKLVKK
ncbi:T9SS type A sorting domain-containing protein [Flavivirga algicola]|uniref:T9SS type A sorting domain-containing protein n=1 Tax=Flavivirga algicola TaxID=2729136 RepID=A0ABX1S4V1_9FLAO|nr:T9SS type A sorting domain-containing protein [Flavivirga algicola]NMH89692.1 T9SS type A sorting domain-containing protein [Flavivirga algicola]